GCRAAFATFGWKECGDIISCPSRVGFQRPDWRDPVPPARVDFADRSNERSDLDPGTAWYNISAAGRARVSVVLLASHNPAGIDRTQELCLWRPMMFVLATVGTTIAAFSALIWVRAQASSPSGMRHLK